MQHRTNLHGICDFLTPQRKNPFLSDSYIKNVFEKRSKNEWLLIKKEFNVRFILVPNFWDLKLNIIKEDKKYKLYQL